MKIKIKIRSKIKIKSRIRIRIRTGKLSRAFCATLRYPVSPHFSPTAAVANSLRTPDPVEER